MNEEVRHEWAAGSEAQSARRRRGAQSSQCLFYFMALIVQERKSNILHLVSQNNNNHDSLDCFNKKKESLIFFWVGVKWVTQSGRQEWPEDLRSLEESEWPRSGAPTQSPGTHLGEPRGVQWRKLIVSWRRRETSLRCWAHRNPAKLRKTRKYAKLSLSLPSTLTPWFGMFSEKQRSCCVGLSEPRMALAGGVWAAASTHIYTVPLTPRL